MSWTSQQGEVMSRPQSFSVWFQCEEEWGRPLMQRNSPTVSKQTLPPSLPVDLPPCLSTFVCLYLRVRDMQWGSNEPCKRFETSTRLGSYKGSYWQLGWYLYSFMKMGVPLCPQKPFTFPPIKHTHTHTHYSGLNPSLDRSSVCSWLGLETLGRSSAPSAQS